MHLEESSILQYSQLIPDIFESTKLTRQIKHHVMHKLDTLRTGQKILLNGIAKFVPRADSNLAFHISTTISLFLTCRIDSRLQVYKHRLDMKDVCDNMECPICFETYNSAPNTPTKMPHCQHIFCKCCLSKMFTAETEEIPTCPMCRSMPVKLARKCR